MLVEAAISMTLLGILGLTLLKLSLNVTSPRQWTLQQSITDAYLTFEKASAQRLPFEELTGNQSLWPADPAIATTTVELGRLPGGTPLMGVVSRTRFPGANNLPAGESPRIEEGDSTTLQTIKTNNPSGMEVWRFQSIIRYQLGGRTYLKSRTVVRSQ
jgi:hypothetical protein